VLLRMLKQSRMDNSRDALMTQLGTVDVLVIDDFALEPMTREESRDIYQLFVERNARLSTVGVDPIWWTPALSKTGVEEVPYVEERNETSPTRPHA
jgi:hypothetical protein